MTTFNFNPAGTTTQLNRAPNEGDRKFVEFWNELNELAAKYVGVEKAAAPVAAFGAPPASVDMDTTKCEYVKASCKHLRESLHNESDSLRQV